MIGQSYSTSHYACMIKFVGGPMDGQEGLFDNDWINAIVFCDWAATGKPSSHEYVPDGYRTRRYRYVKSY